MAGSGPAMTIGSGVAAPVMPGLVPGTGIEAPSFEASCPGSTRASKRRRREFGWPGSGPAMTTGRTVATPVMPGLVPGTGIEAPFLDASCPGSTRASNRRRRESGWPGQARP